MAVHIYFARSCPISFWDVDVGIFRYIGVIFWTIIGCLSKWIVKVLWMEFGAPIVHSWITLYICM